MSAANESKYMPMVALAYSNHGLPPELGCALARQESNWDPAATATNPKDIARGGAYGLLQVTLATAKALGHPTITPEQLIDPAINAQISAELCAANRKSLMVGPAQTYSMVHLYADLAAAYNCGIGHVLKHTIPYVTSSNYVPRVLKFCEQYKIQLSNPLAT